MSPQPSDPFEPPPRHPSSEGAGRDDARPAEPGPGPQPTPQQPYDQQIPSGYGQQGQPPAGHPQPGSLPAGHGQQSDPQHGWSQPGYPPQALAPVSPSDEKLWALLSHLSIPFFGFVVPLVVYLVFRERSAWLRDSALEALNFSILYTVAITASSVLIALLVGLLLLPLVWVVAVVFCILASVAANKHQMYRYPINWRLVT